MTNTIPQKLNFETIYNRLEHEMKEREFSIHGVKSLLENCSIEELERLDRERIAFISIPGSEIDWHVHMVASHIIQFLLGHLDSAKHVDCCGASITKTSPKSFNR